MILYNYGLNEDGVTRTIHHHSRPCPDANDCTEAAMLRYEDTLRTVYEFKIPVQGLGVDSLPNRMAMGFGMCLNDGDTEAVQGGQKGWTGWGPVLDCVRQGLAGVRPDHHARTAGTRRRAA